MALMKAEEPKQQLSKGATDWLHHNLGVSAIFPQGLAMKYRNQPAVTILY